MDSSKSGSGRIGANSRDGGVSDGSLPRELPSLLTLWPGGSILKVGGRKEYTYIISNVATLKAQFDCKIPTA